MCVFLNPILTQSKMKSFISSLNILFNKERFPVLLFLAQNTYPKPRKHILMLSLWKQWEVASLEPKSTTVYDPVFHYDSRVTQI
jgi:hypothetical protein